MKEIRVEDNNSLREPLISVIVPVYNVEKYLERCVNSIINQSYKNLEIILVDDGSKDNSGMICEKLATIDARIKVIHKKNGGLSSARNAALDICTGEYIGFVDSDDWIEKEMYNCLITSCCKSNTLLSCCGRYDVDSETMQKRIGLCPSNSTNVLSSEQTLKKLLTWDGIDSSACDKLFNRELLKEIRFPIGKVCEDIAILYRIVDAAKRVSFVNKPLYNYYHRDGSISNAEFQSSSLDILEFTSEILTYIDDNYPNLNRQAEYFRNRSLEHVLVLLLKCNNADYKAHEELCKELIREYAEHESCSNKTWKAKIKERILSNFYLFKICRACICIFKLHRKES